MNNLQAWLLDAGEGHHLLLSRYVLRAVLSSHEMQQHKLHALPFARTCCHQLLVWHDHIVPVMALLARVQPDSTTIRNTGETFLAIIAIPPENPADPVSYGAIRLHTAPRLITLTNPDAASPANSLFTDIACSYCHNGDTV